MKTITGLKSIVLLALVVLLSGCQLLPTQAAPQPLTGANASVVGASALLLIEMPALSADNYLVPVSARTGQAAPGFAPVDFGRNYAYAFSPDRTQLAFVSSGIDGCAVQCLYVLNLRTWQETLKPIALISQENATTWALLTFNSNASRVAVAYNDLVKPASTLLLVDLAQGKIVQQVSLAQPVFQMGFTPAGGLALYGDAALKQGKNFGLRVLLLDGASLQPLWQQDLEMVQYTSEEEAASLTDPSQGKFLYPAVLLSADNSLLYAVPADQDLLVTVDFAQRSVQSTAIQPRMSLLGRLLTAGAGVVYAKSLNGTYKNGLLSPDGSTLYISGQTSVAVKDSNGDWTAKTSPLGLQAVSTRDGTQLANLPGDVSEINLSTDGKSLLLMHWIQPDIGYSQGQADVVDAGSLKVVQHLNGDIQPTRLLDGSLAWLSNSQQADGSYHLAIYVQGAQNPLSQWNEPFSVFVSWIPIP